MLKTLFAGTAVASVLAFGALAQESATQPAITPPAATEPAAGTGGMMAPAESSTMTEALVPYTGDLSTDTLIGADIRQPDGQSIASVDDVILAPDGAVQSVVAQFGGFLGFGSNKVELSMNEIEVMQNDSGSVVVQTSLTPESLEGRPDYTAAN